MSYELPPKTRGTVLLGSYSGTILPIAVDDGAQLYALLRGALASGGIGTVALDDNGQIIVILKGSSGTNVDVDASGYLSAKVKGAYRFSGAEKILNRGFETPGAGGADVFASWGETVGATGQVVDETTDVYEGSHACKLDPGTDYAIIQQTKTVDASSTYELTFYDHGDGSKSLIYRLYDSTNSAVIIDWTETGNTGGEYEPTVIAVDIPATCTSLLVQIGTNLTKADPGYVDWVSCRKVNVATEVALATDLEGNLKMVPVGRNGYYLDVDSEGNLSALLKAMYGTTPTGVACDADGRLKFFLCDNVDQWGQYLEVGNAELAARLMGSLHAFQRSGQVVYWTQFQHALAPWTSTVAVGGSVLWYATEFLQAGRSIRLTTAGGDADSARIDLDIALPVAGEGIGFGFWVKYEGLPESWWAWLRYHDGTNYHEAYAYFKTSDGKIYVLNHLGALVEVGSWSTSANAKKVWHYCKLAIALDNETYIALWWDNEEIDLTAHSYYQASSSENYLELMFYVNGEDGVNAIMYFDCPVVTVRES
jgi:hypothetical protein